MLWLVLCCTVSARGSDAKKDAKAVRAFFDDYVARSNAFDASVADAFRPDTTIIDINDKANRIELTGAQLIPLFPRLMVMAKARDDRDTYANVNVAATGDTWRITAERTSVLKCNVDRAFHMDVAKQGGGWVITALQMASVSLSECAPSTALAALLASAQATLGADLPRTFDEDTLVEAVTVVGPTLVVHKRFHSTPASDFAGMSALLRDVSKRVSCADAVLRPVLDAGGTLREVFFDKDGVQIVAADTVRGVCPATP